LRPPPRLGTNNGMQRRHQTLVAAAGVPCERGPSKTTMAEIDPTTVAEFFTGDEIGEKNSAELNDLLTLCTEQRLADNVRVDLSIARGLHYYTGTIYETFLLDLEGIGVGHVGRALRRPARDVRRG
jgi:hypothetical protein